MLLNDEVGLTRTCRSTVMAIRQPSLGPGSAHRRSITPGCPPYQDPRNAFIAAATAPTALTRMSGQQLLEHHRFVDHQFVPVHGDRLQDGTLLVVTHVAAQTRWAASVTDHALL
jgi:hypothetical protein